MSQAHPLQHPTWGSSRSRAPRQRATARLAQSRPRDPYHLVVIGAGPAGLAAARGAAALGARVALVERDLLGGECLNYGCIPSKTLIRTSRVYADMRNAAHFGAGVPSDIEVDFAAAMERMRRIRARIGRRDSAAALEKMGIDVFFGDARFVGRDAVDVDGTACASRRRSSPPARALLPANPGPRGSRLPDQRNRVRPDRRCRRVCSSSAAARWAASWRRRSARFGSRSVDRARRADVPAEGGARRGANGFRCAGARRRGDPSQHRQPSTCASRAARRSSTRQRRQRRARSRSTRSWPASAACPNVEGLELEAAGVEYDKQRGIHVDDFLRTTNRRIYAAGDVCLEHQFVHIADASARIVVQNALFSAASD